MYEAGLTACYTFSVPWGIYRGIKTMGKLPAFWFYPGDWIQDTRCLSLAAKGAWIDILCAMWRSPTRGSLSLPIIGWVRLISASVDQTEAIITELVDMQICDTVTDHNKNITLTNRRMVREEKERQQNVDRQKKFREKHHDENGQNVTKRPRNGKSNADVISLLQSSSSISVNTKEKTIVLQPDENSSSTPQPPSELAVKIIDFLNGKTGKQFEPRGINLDMVICRMKEGATPAQCRQIIAMKVREWGTDEKMMKYLRPKTLFNKTNFANYKGELLIVPEEPEEEERNEDMP